MTARSAPAEALDRLPTSETCDFGIWIFLASEVLFFGALFLAYAIDRVDHARRA